MFGVVELTTGIFMIVRKETIVGKDVKTYPLEVHGFIRVEIERGVIKETLVRHISKEVVTSGELPTLRLEAKRYAENYIGVWGPLENKEAQV